MKALCTVAVVLVLVVAASTSQAYQIDRFVIGSGGGSASGSHSIMGTVGQPAIGVSSGAVNVLESGFWYTPGWIITGVPEDGAGKAVFGLEQNSPNPFNPVTTVRYSVAARSDVRISIYNVAGRCVGTIVNGEKDPGAYVVTFDASDLSSGIYFYRMTAGDFSDTRKMLLLK